MVGYHRHYWGMAEVICFSAITSISSDAALSKIKREIKSFVPKHYDFSCYDLDTHCLVFSDTTSIYKYLNQNTVELERNYVPNTKSGQN